VILDRIEADLILTRAYLEQIVRTATYRYKSYPIPKRTGGARIIHHPARELKLLQYWVLQNVLSQVRTHEAATAYIRKRNIGFNAALHAPQNYLLRVDFRDFFPSVTDRDVIRVLTTQMASLDKVLEDETDLFVVAQIVCRGGRLTIGAPTSPTISNVVMFEFDAEWAAASRERGVVYSRYADDLYFSTNERNVLATILTDLREDLRTRQTPRLQINEKKTAFSSRKRRRLVAGLVLTPTRSVSLGRPMRRKIKSLIYSFVRGRLTKAEVQSLKGLVSYARSVEPTFVDSVARKYGAAALGVL
jgi:retron-type reverse transcriptase